MKPKSPQVSDQVQIPKNSKADLENESDQESTDDDDICDADDKLDDDDDDQKKSKAQILNEEIHTMEKIRVETRSKRVATTWIDRRNEQIDSEDENDQEFESENEDGHSNECYHCRDGGFLILCDSCDKAFHLQCLNPPLKTEPEGVWVCPYCVKI